MVPVVPALVQLKVDRFALKAAAGVRTDAEVSFYEDGTYIAKDRGEVQITAYGLSGIPIFQISRCAAKALYYHKNAVVHLDLIPQMDQKELCGFLTKRMEQRQDVYKRQVCTGVSDLLRSAKCYRGRSSQNSENSTSGGADRYTDISCTCGRTE